MSPDPVPFRLHAGSKVPRRISPALLRRTEAADYCGVGASTWDRLSAAGMTPAPIKLGGSVGWSRRELSAWIDHGCPERRAWVPIWTALQTARRNHRKN